MTPRTLPKKLGRYEIQEMIGEGAMGRVYRGFDPLVRRNVAIKTLRSDRMTSETSADYLRRFRREAQAAGGLSHPYILSVFDVGEDYFVMEYLEGTTLLGGWMTARCLFFLNVLTGSVGTQGGTVPNSWTKFVPAPYARPPHPTTWNELTWPKEYPLAFFEMSFLLPHFLKEKRGSLDVYFTRVYNPVWTNPDGFSWMEVLRDESMIGRHAALTPVWSETAWFADYVLPVGLGSERHDLASFETHAGSWIGFRQPVKRAIEERLGHDLKDTRDVNPGEVWEENEFWIELSWRIDPDGSMGIRKHFESPYRAGEKITINEYYRWIFENSVPGLPEAAAGEGLTPLEYMRKYASFEIPIGAYGLHEVEVGLEELAESVVDPVTERVFTGRAA